eukprot:3940372-Rhodomonas_salina.1
MRSYRTICPVLTYLRSPPPPTPCPVQAMHSYVHPYTSLCTPYAMSGADHFSLCTSYDMSGTDLADTVPQRSTRVGGVATLRLLSTDTAYDATATLCPRMMPLLCCVRYWCSVWCYCHAMSGTDVAYDATATLCPVLITLCPVLTERHGMVLPERDTAEQQQVIRCTTLRPCYLAWY